MVLKESTLHLMLDMYTMLEEMFVTDLNAILKVLCCSNMHSLSILKMFVKIYSKLNIQDTIHKF